MNIRRANELFNQENLFALYKKRNFSYPIRDVNGQLEIHMFIFGVYLVRLSRSGEFKSIERHDCCPLFFNFFAPILLYPLIR